MRVSSSSVALLASALMLPLAGCATDAHALALRRRARAAERAYIVAMNTPPAPGWRGTEGFQAARWGMTPDEVRALWPRAAWEAAPEFLSRADRIAGRDARIDFGFWNNRLAAVTVHLAVDGPVRNEFERMHQLLAMKYGAEKSLVDDKAEALRKIKKRTSVMAALASLALIGNGINAVAHPHDPDAQDAFYSTEDATDAAADDAARTEAVIEAGPDHLDAHWDPSQESDIDLIGTSGPSDRNPQLEIVYHSYRMWAGYQRQVAAARSAAAAAEQIRARQERFAYSRAL